MHGVALVSTGRTSQDVIWLDDNFTINLGGFGDLTLNEARELPIGTTLITPPAAVVSGSLVHVFGVGPDHALYHWVYDSAAPFSTRWSPPEMVGVNFWSTPVAVLSGPNQIDLFGLGPERGMLHTRWNGSEWSDWEPLGGAFSSLPAVLPSAAGFDIFARGLDFMVYYANWTLGGAADWQLLGGGLFGEPVAASAPAAVRLSSATLVFVTGADGGVWYTAFDGKLWREWLSMGPAQQAASVGKDAVTFTSEPVPVPHSTGAIGVVGGGGGHAPPTNGAHPVASQPPPFSIASTEHVDVFAVGSDNALWQKRLDHDGWHPSGDWNLVGGSFACAPSVVAWAPQSTGGVLHIPPAHFSLVAPFTDNTIHRWNFDPTPTSVSPVGTWSTDDNISHPTFRLPTRYIFDVSNIQIDNIRSPQSDTDLGIAALKVGGWPLRNASFKFGDLGNGSHDYFGRLGFIVTVELCEPALFTYSIVNNNNPDLEQIIVTRTLKGIEGLISGALKGAAPVVGVLGAGLFTWVADTLLGIAFGGCDGLVAAGSMTYLTGRDLQDQMLQQGSGTPRKFQTSTRTELGNPPTSCQNSNYLVFTSVTQT